MLANAFLLAFQANPLLPYTAEYQVEVKKSVKHSLTLRRVREWLHGASKNPKEAVLKGRLRELL